MKKLILATVLVAIFVSCGDKNKREQALKDLDAQQQQFTDIKKLVGYLEVQVTNMTGELEVAKDNIDQVKEFHILRTEAEREQQIRNAIEYKIKVEFKIDSLKNKIILLTDSASVTQTKIQKLETFLKE